MKKQLEILLFSILVAFVLIAQYFIFPKIESILLSLVLLSILIIFIFLFIYIQKNERIMFYMFFAILLGVTGNAYDLYLEYSMRNLISLSIYLALSLYILYYLIKYKGKLPPKKKSKKK